MVKITNKSNWEDEDIRKIVKRVVQEVGMEKEPEIFVETSKTGRYHGVAFKYGNYIEMRVPNLTKPDWQKIVGADGKEIFERIRTPVEFDVERFCKLLTHELDHIRQLWMHGDMIDWEDIDCSYVKEFKVRPRIEKPKEPIDLRQKRFEEILEKIEEKERRKKRLETALKKLLRKKKYYEKILEERGKKELEKVV